MLARSAFFLVLLGVSAACSSAQPSNDESAALDLSGHDPAALGVFVTPSPQKHKAVVDAFRQAKKSIVMTMFHLTDREVIAALVDAAKGGVSVRLVLDNGNASLASSKPILAELESAGVQIRKSSAGFAITHEKSFVVDGTTATIMSLNLTNMAQTTRDFGLVTSRPDIVSDVKAVFEADWTNAESGARVTPALTSPDVVVSPTNSLAKLRGLVDSAKATIDLTVENLGDDDIEAALVAASQERHVKVRVIVPMCDINKNPLLDYPSLAKLAAAKIESRVMPYPASAEKPYMHAKTIVADGKRAYVGSVNFSKHSIEQARELGLLFEDASVIATMKQAFEADWKAAVDVPNPLPSFCPLP